MDLKRQGACQILAIWLHGASPHVVILLVDTDGPRVFSLCLLSLVVDAVERVDVLLDGVPGGAPHLVDEVDDPDEKQEEDAGQGGKSDDHIEEGVIALLAAWKKLLLFLCHCCRFCEQRSVNQWFVIDAVIKLLVTLTCDLSPSCWDSTVSCGRDFRFVKLVNFNNWFEGWF